MVEQERCASQEPYAVVVQVVHKAWSVSVGMMQVSYHDHAQARAWPSTHEIGRGNGRKLTPRVEPGSTDTPESTRLTHV